MKLLTIVVALILCPIAALAQTTAQKYTPDTSTAFPNPCRGFQPESWSMEYDPISSGHPSYPVTGWQGGMSSNPWGATTFNNYRTGADANIGNAHATVCRRMYDLMSFAAAPIPQSFITIIQNQCDSLRMYGMKMKARFAYKVSSYGYNNPNATKILQDMDSLWPVINRNADVIIAVEFGWVGSGDGEFWGDANWNLSADAGWTTACGWPVNGTSCNYDTATVRNLFEYWLAKGTRPYFIEHRYPRLIRWFWGTTALNDATAYQNTSQARVGFFNDAQSNGIYSDDSGTYDCLNGRQAVDPTNATVANRDTTIMKTFTRTVTCPYTSTSFESDGIDSVHSFGSHQWPAYTYAYNFRAELQAFSMQGGNPMYAGSTTPVALNAATFTMLDKYLGYRFALDSSYIPTTGVQGASIRIRITFVNNGYARHVYPDRGLELILRNHSTPSIVYHLDMLKPFQPPYDPRYWAPNGAKQVLDTMVTIPIAAPLGLYDVLLSLPDMNKTAYHGTALYNRNDLNGIRLANTGTWESSTGFNSLNAQITVNAPSGVPAPAAGKYVIGRRVTH